jgi:tRNA dimethylallyltransferase
MIDLSETGAATNAAVTRPERGPQGGKIRLGLIVGPTGTGKSALALEIAERIGAEIVNADSRLFYRGMDLGTAKPSPADRRRVPHHLVDIVAPDEPLDVAGFRALARRAIDGIAARGRPVIVAGGSGLYLRVLRGGIFNGPPASPEIRRELAAHAVEHGVPSLHARLSEIDPEAAARISADDLYRIIRALEVFRLTGIPISAHQRCHGFEAAEYDTLTIGLEMPRDRLYAAIDRRFDAMVAAGLIEEVRALVAAGYRVDAPPLCAIGYRQIAGSLRGELALADAIALAKRETRRLAKRQLTWFRRDPEIAWLDAERGRAEALKRLQDFLAPAAAGSPPDERIQSDQRSQADARSQSDE